MCQNANLQVKISQNIFKKLKVDKNKDRASCSNQIPKKNNDFETTEEISTYFYGENIKSKIKYF